MCTSVFGTPVSVAKGMELASVDAFSAVNINVGAGGKSVSCGRLFSGIGEQPNMNKAKLVTVMIF
jgi:hypothetical protein